MNRFQRYFVWWTSAVTALSGVVYGWMKYLLQPADPWAVVNHPLEPLVLKLHILAAPLMVFAIGTIAMTHIWRHWRSGLPTGRRSGMAVASVFWPLVVSGYLIQALTSPGVVAAVAWGHIGLGVVCVLGMSLHRQVLWRVRARRRDGLPVVPASLPAPSSGRPRRSEAAIQSVRARREVARGRGRT